MKAVRYVTLFLLVIVAGDFVDPAAGVFSLDTPNLFVDAAVQLHEAPVLAVVLMGPTLWIALDKPAGSAQEGPLSRLALARRTLHPPMKQLYPPSSALGSPEDH